MEDSNYSPKIIKSYELCLQIYFSDVVHQSQSGMSLVYLKISHTSPVKMFGAFIYL